MKTNSINLLMIACLTLVATYQVIADDIKLEEASAIEKIAKAKSYGEMKEGLNFLAKNPSDEVLSRIAMLTERADLTDLNRTFCFISYFQLKCADPVPFEDIIKDRAVRKWFDRHNLRDAASFSAVPVRRAPGLSILSVQPSFTRKEQSACYISFNKKIDIDTIQELINGNTEMKDLWIMEVGLSSPYIHGDNQK